MKVAHHLHLVPSCISAPPKCFYGIQRGNLTLSQVSFSPLLGSYLGAAPGACFISIHFCSNDILGNGMDVSIYITLFATAFIKEMHF
jgi:hypothetical protein